MLGGRIAFNGEQRVMGALLSLVVLALLSGFLSWPLPVQFFLSVGAVIPLAAFIGAATEYLADRLGGKIGGLLNATFGNAPDLLVGYFGVQKGLIPLVKATIVGALISNSALIMGLCYVAAGLLYRAPRFDAREAGHHSVLMMLTVAALVFPSVGALVLCGPGACSGPGSPITDVSAAIAVVLLLAYIAYILFSIFGLESLRHFYPGRDASMIEELGEAEETAPWPWQFSLLVLVLATAALVPVTDILTGTVTAVTGVLHWTQVFVGIVIVANAGNVAEGYAAVRLAVQRGGAPAGSGSGLDLSLGIASASSIQIATFVAPVIVLYSLTTHHMSLVFSPVELVILALLVIIFAYIGHDGESNWLEGVELIALYAMAAIVFYAFPVRVFGA
ncbi:MAG TPA: calcium/proton exchanger [Chloroflexota bacterium]|nr:calcium/proton exchanger [Chloroflexota bacterium]